MAKRKNRKKSTPSFRRDGKRRLKRQRILFFGSILLVGGLIYAAQVVNGWRVAQQKGPDPAADSRGPVVDRREKMSTDQLIDLAENLPLEKDASLPVQMQWIRDKTEISQLLLAKSGDAKAQKEGTLYRLEALQRLSNLNRKYRLKLENVDNELYELSAANLKHPDPEIAKIAAVTIMLTSIHEYYVRPDAGNLKAAIDKSREVALQMKNDPEIAGAIFQYAKSMQQNVLLIAGSVEFFNVVLDTFLSSDNEQARQLARYAYAEILIGDHDQGEGSAQLLISGIRERLRENRDSAEQEVVKRVSYSLNHQLLDDKGIDQVFAMLETLVADNLVQTARELTSSVKQFFSDGQSTQVHADVVSRLESLAIRIDSIGEAMDLTGLVTVIQREPLQVDPIRPRLLIYWSPDNESSVRLISALYGQPLKHPVQVIAICPNAETENLELLQKFAEEMPDFEFVLAAKNPDSDDVQSQLPIPQLPYLILLDRENKRVAINPQLRDLAGHIKNVLH